MKKSEKKLLPENPLLPGLIEETSKPGEVSGTVTKVIFTDATSSFAILQVKSDDPKKTIGRSIFIMQGYGDPATVGDQVYSDGKWVMDAKYGRQFKAKSFKIKIPDTGDAIFHYIRQNNIPGVGKRSAEKLYKHFGKKLPLVMDAPTSLMLSGVTEKQAYAIVDHWALRTRYAKLVSLLLSHNIGMATAKRIVNKYGDDTLTILKRSPYKLSKDIKGIGFKAVDLIALSQSMPKDSEHRIQAALHHLLENLSGNGDCAIDRSRLIRQCEELIAVKPHLIASQIDQMIIDGELKQDKIGPRTVIYDMRLFNAESEVATEFAKRIGVIPVSGNFDHDEIVREAAEKIGIPLHERQHEAAVTAIHNRTMVLTGGPGCGKTSTVLTMMHALEVIQPGINITLAAPTGRAATRMAESTGHKATTLHQMLVWTPVGGFVHNKDNPIQTDIVIIDESSMIDIWMLRDILRALPSSARLVLVGDPDQLPSVGPGSILDDIIASGVTPITTLTEVHRTGAGSMIAQAAKQINSRQMPTYTNPNTSSDMWGIFTEDPEEAVEKTRRAIEVIVEKFDYDPLTDIQVLTAGHNKETGDHNLNKVLQNCLNPRNDNTMPFVMLRNGNEFRLGDRVIQMTNNKDLGVSNGDIGNIISIDFFEEEEAITVLYEGKTEVIYSRSDLDQVSLGYAITIHKSQGSEFPVVLTVLSTQHYMMLKKKLVYTAVSRAKKLCAIIGSHRALRKAVYDEELPRMTGLAQRISNEYLTKQWLGTDAA